MSSTPEGTGAGRTDDPWADLRRATQARIGLGRSGSSLPTRRVLEFAADHAAARDAVHEPLDVDALLPGLRDIGLGEPLCVTSRAEGRSEYLRRPDLGRAPASLDVLHESAAASGDEGGDGAGDVVIVLADGLSPRAVAEHGVALVRALADALGDRYAIAPPVVATQARVALGDHIGQALRARTCLMVIGERPGLSVADSLGIYLTHDPAPGRHDAQRNCISNIHPPEGLDYASAARVTAALVDGSRSIGESGVALKDSSVADAVEEAEASALTDS